MQWLGSFVWHSQRVQIPTGSTRAFSAARLLSPYRAICGAGSQTQEIAKARTEIDISLEESSGRFFKGADPAYLLLAQGERITPTAELVASSGSNDASAYGVECTSGRARSVGVRARHNQSYLERRL